MSVQVRPAVTDEDLEAWRQVRLAVIPDERTATVAEMRQNDEPGRLLVLAELDGVVVGSGLAGRSSLAGRAGLAPRVQPESRRRGVGTALLRVLAEHAQTLGLELAKVDVDGRDEGSLAFALRFGFEEVDRQVEQVKLLGAEPPPDVPAGIELVSVAERPGLLEDAYELATEGYADMATYVPVEVALDEWLREEATLPAGSFVALAGGEIVGYSGLLSDADDSTRAEDGLTVVRRDWRGRRISAVLKQAELAWAAQNGIREVYTWTQRGNDAMRAVNERLGYEYRHVSVTLEAPLAAVLSALAR